MSFFYTLCIAPRNKDFDYYEIQGLDIKQVLGLIPVSKSTLYSMCGKGAFPKPIKIGRLSLWSKEIVNKWVDDKLAL